MASRARGKITKLHARKCHVAVAETPPSATLRIRDVDHLYMQFPTGPDLAADWAIEQGPTDSGAARVPKRKLGYNFSECVYPTFPQVGS